MPGTAQLSATATRLRNRYTGQGNLSLPAHILLCIGRVHQVLGRRLETWHCGCCTIVPYVQSRISYEEAYLLPWVSLLGKDGGASKTLGQDPYLWR